MEIVYEPPVEPREPKPPLWRWLYAAGTIAYKDGVFWELRIVSDWADRHKRWVRFDLSKNDPRYKQWQSRKMPDERL